MFGLRREVASIFLFRSRSLLSGQFVGFRQVRQLEGGLYRHLICQQMKTCQRAQQFKCYPKLSGEVAGGRDALPSAVTRAVVPRFFFTAPVIFFIFFRKIRTVKAKRSISGAAGRQLGKPTHGEKTVSCPFPNHHHHSTWDSADTCGTF